MVSLRSNEETGKRYKHNQMANEEETTSDKPPPVEQKAASVDDDDADDASYYSDYDSSERGSSGSDEYADSANNKDPPVYEPYYASRQSANAISNRDNRDNMGIVART